MIRINESPAVLTAVTERDTERDTESDESLMGSGMVPQNVHSIGSGWLHIKCTLRFPLNVRGTGLSYLFVQSYFLSRAAASARGCSVCVSPYLKAFR